VLPAEFLLESSLLVVLRITREPEVLDDGSLDTEVPSETALRIRGLLLVWDGVLPQ